MELSTGLIAVAAVVSGMVGGVFFAFSTFVMRALATVPIGQGIAAMQRVNVTVINPLFLGVFLGGVPLLAATAYVARGAPSFAWVVASFVVYLVGAVGVTVAFNVPRNGRLAALEAGSAEAAAYWPVYVREWLAWNHVRCGASVVASALAMLAIVA